MGGDTDKLKQEGTYEAIPVKLPSSNHDDDRMGQLAKSNSEIDSRGDSAEIRKSIKKVEHSFTGSVTPRVTSSMPSKVISRKRTRQAGPRS